jgi:hypothetical protein
VNNTPANWPAAQIIGGRGRKRNANNLTFPEAGENWGEIVDFFIADQATGGNVLVYGPLDDPVTIDDGDTPRFVSGDLRIFLD